ncbi:MAG TPA: hypothetical protein VMT46_05030 [Anaerolineaceae bacterium]|nr:hypothetical protein [Anaerolineaceae bacterium]
MKIRLVPLYFRDPQDPDFVKQLGHIAELFQEDAEFLEPVELGKKLPKKANAVVFPQMLGDAYRQLEEFKAISVPILVITSEFGTVSMWDWEINNYLDSEGVRVLSPNSLEQARKIIRAIALKQELKSMKFLVYQDNPGEGFQADIFKRFYWWEKECVERLESRFGIKVVKKSFKKLGARAKQIPDEEVEAVWESRKERIPVINLSHRAILSALKMYLAIKHDLDEDPSIAAAGINCLNESSFSDTTPCLAWNILFEDQRIVWGCEADLVSMMTEMLIHKTLGVPFIMTNLYPFLMGMAALKHEKIPYFPRVESEPENHILMAHCGYLGVVPQSFATDWKVNEKVLAIVDENAHALDARLREGDITLVKLMPPFDTLSVVEGKLEFYAQFENSDCRNGAVVRVPNGPRLMKELASHHYILTTGKNLPDLEYVAQVFGLDCLTIH